jgi:hypothetical protein
MTLHFDLLMHDLLLLTNRGFCVSLDVQAANAAAGRAKPAKKIRFSMEGAGSGKASSNGASGSANGNANAGGGEKEGDPTLEMVRFLLQLLSTFRVCVNPAYTARIDRRWLLAEIRCELMLLQCYHCCTRPRS